MIFVTVMIGIANLEFSPETLHIDWADGKTSELDALWLRDHCQMPECRDPGNGQRLLNVTSIPDDNAITNVDDLGDEGLRITYAPDEHSSIFSLSWLRSNCYCLNPSFDDRSSKHKTLWNSRSFSGGVSLFLR